MGTNQTTTTTIRNQPPPTMNAFIAYPSSSNAYNCLKNGVATRAIQKRRSPRRANIKEINHTYVDTQILQRPKTIKQSTPPTSTTSRASTPRSSSMPTPPTRSSFAPSCRPTPKPIPRPTSATNSSDVARAAHAARRTFRLVLDQDIGACLYHPLLQSHALYRACAESEINGT